MEMKAGDHVRFGKGNKVHVVFLATYNHPRRVDFVNTLCGEWTQDEMIKKDFHPTTEAVDCKKCLAKETTP